MWEAACAYSTYSLLFRSVTSISPPSAFSSTSSICVGCGGGRRWEGEGGDGVCTHMAKIMKCEYTHKGGRE